ncbi:hypothetical protein H4219_006480, partial [Mycoemilia scoparia]
MSGQSQYRETNRRVPVPPNLPRFCEGQDCVKDPTEFFTRFRRALIAGDADPDIYWARFLPICVPSVIATWIETRCDSSWSFTKIRKIFIDRFDNELSTADAIRSFYAIRIKHRETVSDFLLRFDQAMINAKISGADCSVVNFFITCLPNDVHWAIHSAIKTGTIAGNSTEEIAAYVSQLPPSRHNPEDIYYAPPKVDMAKDKNADKDPRPY